MKSIKNLSKAQLEAIVKVLSEPDLPPPPPKIPDPPPQQVFKNWREVPKVKYDVVDNNFIPWRQRSRYRLRKQRK